MKRIVRFVVTRFALWLARNRLFRLVLRTAGLRVKPSRVRLKARARNEFPILPHVVREPPKRICVVYLCIGADVIPLTKQSVQSLRAVNADIPIFICSDVGEAERSGLEKLGAEIVGVEKFGKSFRGHYSAFGSEEFSKVTSTKWASLLDRFSDDYELVLFVDSDIVFFKDPVEYIVECSMGFPSGLQSESHSVFPPEFCTGFMYFHANARPLIEYLWESSQEGDRQGNDQVFFNEAVANFPELLSRIYELPGTLFLNGLSYPFLSGQAHNDQVAELQPFLFHANFFVGIETKQNVLRDVLKTMNARDLIVREGPTSN